MDLENLRHSAAHLLAAAVMELWPDTKRTIGPAIEDGFYFDFEFSTPITQERLPKIEKKMRELLPTWKGFEKHELTAAEAKKEYKDNPYKIELIEEFSQGGKKVTFYKSGKYWDLCKGGHVEHPNTELKYFKLQKIAGAYWRGSEKNKMLTRIYGTAFPTQKELDDHLLMLEESKKRDHRVLGEQLGLVMMHEYSPGAPFFLPKGTIIYTELVNFIRSEYRKRGYKEVITPLLYNKKLWETSGHWDHYKENMFHVEVEKEVFNVKPMNCPSHCLIYKNKLWSYRELPLRIADFAPLHRNELSGTLTGLTRVRKFSQDDAHIYVTEDQLEQEIGAFLEFEKFVYKEVFGFEYHLYVGTRPESFMGDSKLWDKAESILQKVLKEKKMPFTIKEKDGAFYGPKIDLRIKDALGREWQTGTVQLDFQMPLRFELNYEGADGKKHTPIMIHRAILGSLERFFGLLIEHFAGKFPVWLAPVQVSLITVADRHNEFANKLKEEFERAGVRVEVDDRSESIGKKVRDHQAMKDAYVITLGDREIESDDLAIRDRENKVFSLKKDEFIERIKKEIKERTC
ncbi:MAG: threonine--tRNA ligase [Candidatus Nanoarchaeia archaeon]